jgi:hypothetical protein
MFADDPEKHRHEGRILDSSTAGAGIELSMMIPEHAVGTTVLLAAQRRGELWNIVPGRNAGLRIGI